MFLLIYFFIGVIALILGIYNLIEYFSIPKNEIWHHSAITHTTIYYKDYFMRECVIPPIGIGLVLTTSTILIFFM